MSGVVEQVRNHPVFQQEMAHIRELERDRIYCCHGMQHLMDVARIGYLMIQEAQMDISRDLFYTTALLHDIGKGIQYEEGTPHQLAGLPLAEQILGDCDLQGSDLTSKDIPRILEAIRFHREPKESQDALVTVLYKADKKSRPCYDCAASEDCNWPEWKRNLVIEY